MCRIEVMNQTRPMYRTTTAGLAQSTLTTSTGAHHLLTDAIPLSSAQKPKQKATLTLVSLSTRPKRQNTALWLTVANSTGPVFMAVVVTVTAQSLLLLTVKAFAANPTIKPTLLVDPATVYRETMEADRYQRMHAPLHRASHHTNRTSPLPKIIHQSN